MSVRIRSRARAALCNGVSALALCVLASGGSAAAGATFTTIDVNGASNTYAQAINAGGAVTGYYQTADYADHGFVRAADGTITTFDPTGATITTPLSINVEIFWLLANERPKSSVASCFR